MNKNEEAEVTRRTEAATGAGEGSTPVAYQRGCDRPIPSVKRPALRALEVNADWTSTAGCLS